MRKIDYLKYVPYLVILLFTSSLFYVKFGFSIIAPLNYYWLLPTGSDTASDFMAWLFYKNDVWRFPIGVFEGYSYPEQVGVGLTGAIPLLAIPLKLISPILPDVFQYYGIWLFFCYFLQGVLGYKVLERLKIKSQTLKIIGACFIALSYSLIDRTGHLNLCGHWIILLSLYYYFGEYGLQKLTFYHFVAIAISILVHPYLVIFTISIFTAHLLQFIYQCPNKYKQVVPVITSLIIQVSLSVIIWYVLGNTVIDTDQAKASGFGYYSANLNSFFNPKMDSFFLKSIPNHFEGQYEGIAYLGLGGLILILTSIFIFIKNIQKIESLKKYLPILILAIILFLFSLSHIITFHDKLMLEIPLNHWLIDKFNILRASGRYIWLLQYLLIIYSIKLWSKFSIKDLYKNMILAILLILNIIDFTHALERELYYTTNYSITEISDITIWESIYQGVDDVLMFPSYEKKYVNPYDAIFFAYQAAKTKKFVNSGHLARFNQKKRDDFQNELLRKIRNNDFTDSSTFITNENNIGHFIPLLRSKRYELYNIDRYFVLIPKIFKDLHYRLKMLSKASNYNIQKEYLIDFLDKYHKTDVFLIFSAKDEAKSMIQKCLEGKLDKSSLPLLKYREPYIGIFHSDSLVNEIVSNGKNSLSMTHQIGEKNIEIISEGKPNGVSSIKINNIEYSKNMRGINIVVIDKTLNIINSYNFDTYKECHHFTTSNENIFEINVIE